MLTAFAIEMEAALTDAALVMVEKMVGSLFRRADRTRSDRLLGQAKLLKDTARVHVQLGRLLLNAYADGGDAFAAIEDRMGWDELVRSVRCAEDLTRAGDDGHEEVVERYPRCPQVRADLPRRVHLSRVACRRPAALGRRDAEENVS